MVKRSERSIDELYMGDPEHADAVVFERRTDSSRRGFLSGAGLTAMGAVLGAPVVFGAHMPGGLMPAALAQDAQKEAGAQAPKAAAMPSEAITSRRLTRSPRRLVPGRSKESSARVLSRFSY